MLRSLGRLLPRPDDYRDLRSSWRGDVVAGLTVGVVALPLALAFGITTGLGAAAGLTTAIVAGVVAGFLGGSNLQVSGPTGAMTVVLVPIVAQVRTAIGLHRGAHGGPADRPRRACCRLGRCRGLHPVAGGRGLHGRHRHHHLPAAGARGARAWRSPPARTPPSWPPAPASAAGAVSWQTLALVAVVVACHGRRCPASTGPCPSSLLAVIAATARGPGGRVGRRHHRHAARLAAHAVAPGSGPTPRSCSRPPWPSPCSAAIESLLSAKVADGMADVEPADPDRELFGQGLANIASALLRRDARDRRHRPHGGERPGRGPHPRWPPSCTRRPCSSGGAVRRLAGRHASRWPRWLAC